MGQQGTPREVYVRPASPAVARQLGLAATNIFPVTVAEGKVRRPGAGDSPGLEIGRVHPESLPAATEAVMGIRPEDLDPAGGKQPARVLVVEEAGPRVSVLAEWGGEPIHLALERAADRPAPGGNHLPAAAHGPCHLVAAVSRNEKPAQWYYFWYHMDPNARESIGEFLRASSRSLRLQASGGRTSSPP